MRKSEQKNAVCTSISIATAAIFGQPMHVTVFFFTSVNDHACCTFTKFHFRFFYSVLVFMLNFSILAELGDCCCCCCCWLRYFSVIIYEYAFVEIGSAPEHIRFIRTASTMKLCYRPKTVTKKQKNGTKPTTNKLAHWRILCWSIDGLLFIFGSVKWFSDSPCIDVRSIINKFK